MNCGLKNVKRWLVHLTTVGESTVLFPKAKPRLSWSISYIVRHHTSLQLKTGCRVVFTEHDKCILLSCIFSKQSLLLKGVRKLTNGTCNCLITKTKYRMSCKYTLALALHTLLKLDLNPFFDIHRTLFLE